MEMKPEYSYGNIKTYDVNIYGDECGNNKHVLQKIYDESGGTENFARGGSKNAIKNWRKYIGKPQIIMYWRNISDTDFRNLKTNLDSLGIIPEVCLHHVYFAFPEVKVGKRNYWWSRDLTKTREFSLTLWAEEYQIDEAYRVVLDATYTNTIAIRIWRKDASYNLVHTVGGKSECDYSILKSESRAINSDNWMQLKSFMDNNFWTSQSWMTYGPSQVPEIYVFEGWQNGQHKLLFDYTPIDETLETLRAFDLFYNLVK